MSYKFNKDLYIDDVVAADRPAMYSWHDGTVMIIVNRDVKESAINAFHVASFSKNGYCNNAQSFSYNEAWKFFAEVVLEETSRKEPISWQESERSCCNPIPYSTHSGGYCEMGSDRTPNYAHKESCRYFEKLTKKEKEVCRWPN